jgi:4-hydroxy-4-methyl-2-oxoglutarate aldolase
MDPIKVDLPNIEHICCRFSVIYAGAISDVLDEMGYSNQCLPSSIQAPTLDTKVTGIAIMVEGRATLNHDPEEIFIPILKMLGDLRPGDVIVSQPNGNVAAHLGELSCESAPYRSARGAVIDGKVRNIGYILKVGSPVLCRYRTHRILWVPHNLPPGLGQETFP